MSKSKTRLPSTGHLYILQARLHLQLECQFLFHFEKFYLVLFQIYLIALIACLSLFNFFWIIELLLLRLLVPFLRRLSQRLRLSAAGRPWPRTQPRDSVGGASSEGGFFQRNCGCFHGVRALSTWCHFKLKSRLEVFVCFLRRSTWGGVGAETREAPSCKWSGEHMHVYLHVAPPSAKFKTETPLRGTVLSLKHWGGAWSLPSTNPGLHPLPLGPWSLETVVLNLKSPAFM